MMIDGFKPHEVELSNMHHKYKCFVDSNSETDIPYYERTVKEILVGGLYSCMICTIEMDNTCRMYACPSCYRVFDYDCIAEWASKSINKSVEKIWKCPNCYLVNRKIPIKNGNTCWCGKVLNPELNRFDPNSCGQTCNAPSCIHGCSKPCHLGPHPECMVMTTLKCLCGKQSKEVYCYQRNLYKDGFQCESICGLTMPDGIHKCSRKCHSGLCGECMEIIQGEIKCYCGLKTMKELVCKDIRITGRSLNKRGKSWIGVFSCDKTRKLKYSCGFHSFVESCKAPPSIDHQVQCPFSPKVLRNCPCGKTSLKLLGMSRDKCTDIIPKCDELCGKQLSCGKHTCPFTCHDGDCMDPCTITEKTLCSCNTKIFLTPCQFGQEPQCNTKCESLMSCRRHRCVQKCCPGKPLSQKREKQRHSTQDAIDGSLIEAQHICLKQCNRKLTCGVHYCQKVCHIGKCGPCLESDSNDLFCTCRKTIISAPVRCGTQLPQCKYPCIKTLEKDVICGHKQIPHKCHPLNEKCPLCTVTVFKQCKCGKEKNVRTLCFQRDISCGKICGRSLDKCSHACQKICHIEGYCETDCKQVCGKRKKSCNHTCIVKCHPNIPCPEILCEFQVKVFCKCGRKESLKICGAHDDVLSSTEREQLECDEVCVKLKRHHMLAYTFGIQQTLKQPTVDLECLRLSEKFDDLHLPFSEETLAMYKKQPAWCTEIETVFNELINNQSKSSFHFKPMKPVKRRFIHQLAAAYLLYSESQDSEPKRSVFIKKNSDSFIPIMSLIDSLPLYKSFKEMETKKKLDLYEKSTTKVLINIKPNDPEHKPSNIKKNAFLIKSLSPNMTVDDLCTLFGGYLRHSLLKNPQYYLHNGDAFIYPENYLFINNNVENDMSRIVNYFDSICQEKNIGKYISLCKLDQDLNLII